MVLTMGGVLPVTCLVHTWKRWQVLEYLPAQIDVDGPARNAGLMVAQLWTLT
jgi:hypothetical protein